MMFIKQSRSDCCIMDYSWGRRAWNCECSFSCRIVCKRYWKFYQVLSRHHWIKTLWKEWKIARFNYDSFSLLITSDTVLSNNHYFNSKAKSEVKGNGFELIIVVDELEKVHSRCLDYNYPIEVDVEKYPWDMRGFKIADPDGYFLRITSK